MGASQRPTIKTVAARAGVGRTTVSRVLNGSPLVSDAAKAAVEAAISELNYVPNSVARSLVTSRADSIALVIPESESRLGSEPYFSAVIRGVSTGLAESQIQLLLVLVRDQRELDQFTRFLAARRVDGVLLVSVHRDDPLPGLLEEMGLPTVLAGRRSPDEVLPHVHSDNLGGAAEAVRHLLERGRTRIATISGPLDMDVGHSRLQGWRDELRRGGLEPDESMAEPADFTEEGGRAAIRALLERHPGLDAVFAASDVMAAGAVAELRKLGRRIPEDVAVVGFDDSIIARHTDPPLTTVRQPVEELGRTITELLLKEIDEPGSAEHSLVLPTSLVVRDSS
ncbi:MULTISPECIES: LacI family DNA-binding transcriptional regulator [Streptomyces]|uniref:LacI family DNA-binding transcriptional regulator n=1 Tax=Streptomyces TaxID=1883 RepID=UPI001D134C26|nr:MULTISPECIES: LacI family DNA-binding transcriptional regulator [Streptomyces]MCC3655642.1 LacI family transcriptional regulator [Streptomyces sp. S07_1.15]WSQ70045.1 LacI family transcriptional regulator [Streptomyces xinghaiensis]